MIYCVEDDTDIREIEIYTLRSLNMEAEGFADSRSFFEALSKQIPDLILLDVMLPDGDGVDILKRLRRDVRTRQIPVIMATAKGAEYERIGALDAGADDYLAKPCNPRELLARVRAVLRRPREDAAAEGPALLFAGWRLDLLRRELTRPDGELVSLSAGEFALLRAFAERPGRVMTRDQLLERARGADADVFDRAMDVQISRLRKKLDDGSGLEMIQTLRGEAYLFDVRVERRRGAA